MIKITTIFYIIVMTALFIWFLINFFSESHYDFGSKHKYSVGYIGAIAIIIAIVFNLIWGGIFWW